jgi:hypothetical protein
VSVLWRGAPGVTELNASDDADRTTDNWQPKPFPGEKPNVEEIYLDTAELRSRERYEEALERLQWLHAHGVKAAPSSYGVRLSFWLQEWSELARRYPKAKRALLDLRDQKSRELVTGRGHFELFHDVESINACLQEDAATLALFKQLEKADPQLAEQCKGIVEEVIARKTPAQNPSGGIKIEQSSNGFPAKIRGIKLGRGFVFFEAQAAQRTPNPEPWVNAIILFNSAHQEAEAVFEAPELDGPQKHKLAVHTQGNRLTLLKMEENDAWQCQITFPGDPWAALGLDAAAATEPNEPPK